MSQFLEPIEVSNHFSIPVFWIPECTSTMEVARDLISRSFSSSSGFLVLSGHQTQGRGRHSSRPWIDLPGNAFLSTLWLGPKFTLVPPLSLRVGLAVARTIEESLEIPVALKWPNDILLGHRKAGGILIENLGGRGYLIGLGLNLRGSPRLSTTDEDDRLNLVPTSLEAEARAWGLKWGEPVPSIPSPRDFARSYLERLGQTLDDPHWRSSVKLRLAYRGEQVFLKPPGIQGALVGIGEEGDLLLDLPDGGRGSYSTGSLRRIVETPPDLNPGRSKGDIPGSEALDLKSP